MIVAGYLKASCMSVLTANRSMKFADTGDSNDKLRLVNGYLADFNGAE